MIVTMLPGSPAAGTSVPDATGGPSTPSGPFGQLLAALSGHPAPSAAGASGPLADAEATVVDLGANESPVSTESETDTPGAPEDATSKTAESASVEQLSAAKAALVEHPTQLVGQDAVLIAAKILLSHPRPVVTLEDRAGEQAGVGGAATDAKTGAGGDAAIEPRSEVAADPDPARSLSTLVGGSPPSTHDAPARPKHLATTAPHPAVGTAAGPAHDAPLVVPIRDTRGTPPAAVTPSSSGSDPAMLNPISVRGVGQSLPVGLHALVREDLQAATVAMRSPLSPAADGDTPTMLKPSGEHAGTSQMLAGGRQPAATDRTGQPPAAVPVDATRPAPGGDADSAEAPPMRVSAGPAAQTPTDAMPRSAGTALTELAGHTDRQAEPTQVEAPALQVENATRAGTTDGGDRQSSTITRPAAVPSTMLTALQDMRRSGDARRRIVVRLDPPDLGSVTIELTAVGDDVHIAARAESAEAVRAILRQHAEVLSALQTQGLSLTEFDVQAEADDPTRRHRALGPNAAGGETAGESTDDERGAPTTDEGAIFL